MIRPTPLCLVLILPVPLKAQDRYMQGHPSPQLRAALNANTDLLGEAILATGEPSFERVMSIFPPLGRPRTNVGVAEHPEEIGIGWDGSIELSRKLSFRIGEPPSPHGFDGPVRQSLLKGYLPVVLTRWQYDGLDYELAIFAHSPEMSADTEVSAYAGLSIHNLQDRERATRITVYSFPALGGETQSFKSRIVPGETARLHFRLPYQVRADQLVEPIGEEVYQNRLRDVLAYWEPLLESGKVFVTPEPRINDGQLAWLMYNFLNVDKKDGWCRIHDGGRFYENVYGYSAGLYCHALSLFGYWEQSERYLKDMLHFQQDDGQFRTSYGLPDNGAILYAIGQHYRLSRNDGWWAEMAPAALKCCEWITKTRAKTKVLKDGERELTFGLLTSGDRPYADYPGQVFSYYVDGYSWLGLREVAAALKAAGRHAEGDRWMAEANAYREDILHSMDRAAIDVGSIRALPVEPVTQRLIKQGGGDYYGLIAPMLLETGFFAPDDPRAEWITRPMEQLGGLMLGMVRFADGIDHAYTYGYAMTQLRRGHVDRFLLALYGSLAHGMDRGTYASVEVTHAPVGINDPTLPHTYSHTQQLRWIRMMHVREEGDELWLSSGTPRRWLGHAEPVRVRRAPTVFGRISFSLVPDPAIRQVTAVIEPVEQTGHPLPKRVILVLRKPAEWGQLKDLTVNGRSRDTPKTEQLSLDPRQLRTGLEIVARFQ